MYVTTYVYVLLSAYDYIQERFHENIADCKSRREAFQESNLEELSNVTYKVGYTVITAPIHSSSHCIANIY